MYEKLYESIPDAGAYLHGCVSSRRFGRIKNIWIN